MYLKRPIIKNYHFENSLWQSRQIGDFSPNRQFGDFTTFFLDFLPLGTIRHIKKSELCQIWVSEWPRGPQGMPEIVRRL